MWSSLERDGFYLVLFGLFFRDVLKGTVRTSFLTWIPIKKEEKKKKQTKKQMNDWLRNKVVFIWDLFFYFLFFWAQSEAGGGEGHADQKIESCLSTTWYDTVDNAVPCGKSLFPWKSSVWKAVGQRNKEDGDRKSSFWDTKWCWPSCWFFFSHYFWTGIEGHIRQRSPSTNCPSGPRLLKRLGAGESQLKVLGVAFF